MGNKLDYSIGDLVQPRTDLYLVRLDIENGVGVFQFSNHLSEVYYPLKSDLLSKYEIEMRWKTPSFSQYPFHKYAPKKAGDTVYSITQDPDSGRAFVYRRVRNKITKEFPAEIDFTEKREWFKNNPAYKDVLVDSIVMKKEPVYHTKTIDPPELYDRSIFKGHIVRFVGFPDYEKASEIIDFHPAEFPESGDHVDFYALNVKIYTEGSIYIELPITKLEKLAQ